MSPLHAIVPFVLAAAFTPTQAQRLLHSRELWATVNVCSPKDQPNTIGIRGSMPGDGHAKDTMYMRFTVQYEESTTKQWAAVGKEADSGFLKVGSADLARQAGRSFQFAPAAGKPAYVLRGDVVFQWRRGTTVLETTTVPTTASHKSLAGADPTGYSSATCTLA
ncbi:MAG: hypothetical protein WB998_01275 [Solirubrobacteraceae bacterium]